MNSQTISWRTLTPLYVGGALSIITVVMFSVVYASRQTPTGVVSCTQHGTVHRVVIQNDAMHPARFTAKQCDTLHVENRDAVTREIGFGEHDHHVAYNGVTEKVLHQNESFDLVLNRTGTYRYHDHFHDEVEGVFTVKR